MTQAKVAVSIGGLSFEGEGSEEWLTEQLDKILDRAEDIADMAPKLLPPPANVDSNGQDTTGQDTEGLAHVAKQSLVSFLKDKNALSTQTDKFLVTAIWLQARGKKQLKTSDVTQALRDASQGRLGNASDCLAQNLRKGFCERDGQEFFVTQEGYDSVGI